MKDSEILESFSAKYNYGLNKVFNVIESCNTSIQLEGAERYLNNFIRYWDKIGNKPFLKQDTNLCYSLLDQKRNYITKEG